MVNIGKALGKAVKSVFKTTGKIIEDTVKNFIKDPVGSFSTGGISAVAKSVARNLGGELVDKFVKNKPANKPNDDDTPVEEKASIVESAASKEANFKFLGKLFTELFKALGIEIKAS